MLAWSGRALPLLPRYDYEPHPGDAYGYYSAVRELLATGPRLGTAGLAGVALALVGGGFVAIRAWRRGAREWAVVAASAGLGLAAAVVVLRMRSAGAPTIGWPIVWALPLLPYRAAGLPLDPDIAFGFGLAVSLAAIAAAVVWIDLLGRWATGRASVGLVAATAFGLWPLLSNLLADQRGAAHGAWQGELGLSLYTEPLSTLLVLVGMALVVRGNRGPPQLALAGALLGFSVSVRLSNAVLVVCALAAVLARDGLRRSLPFLAAALSFAPLVLAYWPKGYAELPEGSHAFGLQYVRPNWTESLLWTPRALLVLVPLAVLGSWAVRGRRRLALLWSWILATAAFYTPYRFTSLHPRFLFVALPALLVLWSAGLVLVAARAGRLRTGSRANR